MYLATALAKILEDDKRNFACRFNGFNEIDFKSERKTIAKTN